MDENRISLGFFVKFPSGRISRFFTMGMNTSEELHTNLLFLWNKPWKFLMYSLIISVVSQNRTDDSWNFIVVLRNHSDDLVFWWLVRGYVRRVFGECNIPLAPFKGGLMRLMNLEGKMKDFYFLNGWFPDSLKNWRISRVFPIYSSAG